MEPAVKATEVASRFCFSLSVNVKGRDSDVEIACQNKTSSRSTKTFLAEEKGKATNNQLHPGKYSKSTKGTESLGTSKKCSDKKKKQAYFQCHRA